MTEFTKYLSLKLDKSEENLYVISDETGKRELHSYNLKDKSYVKVTNEQENVKNYWFTDGGLLTATDLNGNEREQLTYTNKEEKVQLTADDDYYHHYGVYMNGDFIFLRNHKEGKIFELINYSDRQQKVLSSFEEPSSIIGKLDDNHILMSQAINNLDKKIFIFNVKTGELTDTELPSGRFGNYRSLNDTEALFTSDYLEGHLNLYKLNKETFEFKKLTYFKWDIQKVIVLEDKNNIVFEVNKKGFSKLFKYDVRNDLLETLDFSSCGVVHSLANSQDKLYVLYSDMATPHAVYEFDLTVSSTEKLFGNEEIDTQINTTYSTYPSFDGLDVPYYLYQQNDKAPTAIHVHGGPESQARPEFNELYYKLYKEGYQIAVPNIRGSTGYSKFYIGLDNQEKRMDAAKDVVELRQHLINKHQADKDNIFIMGRSYGGFMTLLLITQFPKLWKGAVDIVGISHFTTLLSNTPAWRREQRSYEYGFIGEHDEFMQCIAPLNNTQRIRCPLKIFHSHNDVRVPYSESVQMYERMKEEKKDVELTAYENEGHQYLYTENQDDMNTKIIKFFNEQTSK
ncbi:alpha/beta hydrolase family protein [Jeotgalicoccus halotolerans]|uniref:Prolyl oligopeptidase family protein n=1 Tax=Jeotgalicoccus halotolerans TaxID=157227 RepID=A0A3E0B4W9_9STAP|nr:prolyl oligopeptidase family serine peptidase [Jeotgalicoccus halotolerans]REG26242.1 prolyl oligopeptidase family protein [Jeotgalicoccus halotolerans]